MKQGWILEGTKAFIIKPNPSTTWAKSPGKSSATSDTQRARCGSSKFRQQNTGSCYWRISIQRLSWERLRFIQHRFPFSLCHTTNSETVGLHRLFFLLSFAKMRHPRRDAKHALWRTAAHWTPSYFISQFARHSRMLLQAAAAVKGHKSGWPLFSLGTLLHDRPSAERTAFLGTALWHRLRKPHSKKCCKHNAPGVTPCLWGFGNTVFVGVMPSNTQLDTHLQTRKHAFTNQESQNSLLL